jgi:MFS transporter, DHA2 family, metal-tetracycline-proton antiporter
MTRVNHPDARPAAGTQECQAGPRPSVAAAVSDGEPEAKSCSTRIVLVLCYSIFFSALNATMFNVAVPDISRQFHLTPSRVSWVVTAYVAIFGLGSVVYGKLADVYPIRKLITFGLVLFNLGSLIGFFSQWFPMLLAGRMLQAVGGAAIPSLAMLIGIRYIPAAMRGRVLGSLSSAIACGGAFGPIFGGFIAGHFHWRYLFLVSSATLLTIPFYHRMLPDEESSTMDFDYLGGALLGGTIVSSLCFLAQSMIWGLPAGILFLLGFVLRIRYAAAPFILPALFRNRRYRNGLLALFLSLGTAFGMMFTLPLMLRNLNHLATQAIGVVIFPGAMAAAVLSFASGRLSDRKGSVRVVYIGMGLLLAGYSYFSLSVGAPPPFITLGLVISYSGFSIVQSSLAKTVSMTLPSDQAGVGMGMYNLTFFMSGSFGAAIASRIIEAFAHGPALNPFVPAEAGCYSDVFVFFVGLVSCAALIFFRTFHQFDRHLVPEQPAGLTAFGDADSAATR